MTVPIKKLAKPIKNHFNISALMNNVNNISYYAKHVVNQIPTNILKHPYKILNKYKINYHQNGN
jgi:hypothetical protein